MPATESKLLDQQAVEEILKRAAKYKQLAKRAATPADEEVIRWLASTVSALCATVKHLRAEK